MTTRLTESRFPAGGAAALGQSAEGGGFALISYLESPLTVDSAVQYVLFGLNGNVADQCEWTVFHSRVSENVHQTGSENLFKYTPPAAGTIQVVVNITSGAAAQTLSLTQDVADSNVQIEALVNRVIPPSGPLVALGGDPITSRELVNDLRVFVTNAVAATNLDGRGIPKELLAALLYREILFRPKEYTFSGTQFYLVGGFVRENEIGTFADALINGVDLDRSLGVAQIKPQTAAMLLGLTPWRELPRDPALRPPVADQIFKDYGLLSATTKVDLFNLLRFPKSNIDLCARLLARLKNRAHRWPDLAPDALLRNELAMRVIASEYNLGASETPQAAAMPTAYGGKVYTVTGSPYLLPFFAHRVTAPAIAWIAANAGNFNVAARTAADIDSIVLHTIEGTANAGIQWFQDPASNVSAHFVISAAGAITQMVEIKDIAITSNYYNDRSISIECAGAAAQANTWTPALMASMAHLCAWLCQEYGIVPIHPECAATAAVQLNAPGIVGHNQIHGYAPFNKDDPGPHFDWSAFITAVQDHLLGPG